MKFAVLGTGSVGRTLAARLTEVGHQVTVGTRDPRTTLRRREPDAMGAAPYAEWAAGHRDIGLATFAEATSGADIVVNATNGAASIEVLTLAGGANLSDKVLLDIANPLDFSRGMPPTLFVKDADSLAEQIQRTFPKAKVVKALNTLTAELMAHPASLPEDSSVFVSGDDAQAKDTVTSLLKEFGHTDIIDLGDLSTARGTEMLLPLWLRLWAALGTPKFNIKVVR